MGPEGESYDLAVFVAGAHERGRFVHVPWQGDPFLIKDGMSTDGRLVASGSLDRTISIWENSPVSHYVNELCGYIDNADASKIWRHAEPRIGYVSPC